MRKFSKLLLTCLLGILLTGCGSPDAEVSGPVPSARTETDYDAEETAEQSESAEIESGITEQAAEDSAKGAGEVTCIDVPFYDGKAYTEINGNVPYFTDDELSAESYETYAELDSLGRCGVCMASVGQDIMPTEEREGIGEVKPTGWHTVKYEGIVEGNYLYNRCHLLGYQLTGENANRQNLITGTRYMNVEGMLPFENMVADYVKETGNHVMYRVTPLFDGDNLVADGVLMEAKSVEDHGADILFNVFCYNVQPGILIDYATGESSLDDTAVVQAQSGERSSVIVSEEKQGQQQESQEQLQTQEQQTAQTQQEQQTAQTQQEQQAAQIQQEEPVQQQAPSTGGGSFAVNPKNGKIHIVGACPATGTSSKAMSEPVYFNTYEEAEAYSVMIAPNENKRQCGNCW